MTQVEARPVIGFVRSGDGSGSYPVTPDPVTAEGRRAVAGFVGAMIGFGPGAAGTCFIAPAPRHAAPNLTCSEYRKRMNRHA
jgi:hypothetical protein